MDIEIYLAQIIDELREQTKAVWATTQESEVREHLWHQFQALNLVDGKLRARIQSEEFER